MLRCQAGASLSVLPGRRMIVGYLLGSIPFGLVFTRLAGTQDIRAIGSGSIGATNVLRTGRYGLAAATLLADLLKGTVAVLLMFSVKDMTLKQWTITDPQGFDTTVALANLDPTKKLDPAMFRINYERKEIMQ